MSDDEIRLVKSPALTPEDLVAIMGAPVFDPPSLDVAITGIALNDDGDAVVVYSFDKLVECYANDYEGESDDPWQDATDWVEYNTLGSLQMMGPRAPRVE